MTIRAILIEQLVKKISEEFHHLPDWQLLKFLEEFDSLLEEHLTQQTNPYVRSTKLQQLRKFLKEEKGFRTDQNFCKFSNVDRSQFLRAANGAEKCRVNCRLVKALIEGFPDVNVKGMLGL